MKKGVKTSLKVLGISLGSLIGLALIVVLVAVYVVLTPSRLTPIVRGVVDDYVSCEKEVGEVDLTFLSTFPEFGVRIDGLYLINKMDGAQSDTLLGAPEVVATVDVMRYLRDKVLEVHEIRLSGAEANLFFDEEGQSNMDVFVLGKDMTEDEDTTGMSLPFEELQVERLRLDAKRLSYVDRKGGIDARLRDVELESSVRGLEDVDLSLLCGGLSAEIDGERYADDLRVSIKTKGASVSLDTLGVRLREARLEADDFGLELSGEAQLVEAGIWVDANVRAEDWDVVKLIGLLPKSVVDMIDGIEIRSGKASVEAQVRGLYNDDEMPIVDADLRLRGAEGAYMEVFPYRLSDIRVDASAHVDLNDEKQSSARIDKLHARTGKTMIDATGKVSELLGDLLADVEARMKVNLVEFKGYLESDGIATDLRGWAEGKAKAKIRLSDLEQMRLSKGDIRAQLTLTDFGVLYDSITLDTKKMGVDLQIPNRSASRKEVGWLRAQLTPMGLDAGMIDFAGVRLEGSKIDVEASDVLKDEKMVYATVGLQTEGLRAEMDSMLAVLAKPELKAYVEYDMKSEESIPLVEAQLGFDDLQVRYTDIDAHLRKSDVSAWLSGSRRDKSQPRAKVVLNTAELRAKMGEEIDAQTKSLSVTATAVRNPKGETILTEWNPRLSVDLSDGLVRMQDIAEDIQVPKIRFDYSNKDFEIADSRIVIGNSDFGLRGSVKNIGKWMEKKGVLEGVLEFESEHTDVNELMALVSADSGTEETEEQAVAQAEASGTEDASPFLVPKDVDLTLTTNIREAVVFDQLARDLGGRLYVKDGVLVLEEMGFVCQAAKLQLTAIYKTPRRNHLYVGLDYHMLDVKIEELVNMIPQIDTMMPMLRSFRGGAEFHLAAETYMNERYDLKMSTARGACSISGKDLVLLDSETFGQIAKILLFNKKTENLVDSISVQATLYKKEIDIYPFCLTIDKYMAAVGGRHNTDMSFDYHIDLLRPLYIGVDVNGTFDDLKIRPAKCKYAQDFRPIIRRDVETQNASLKKMIDAALKRNVKIEE